MFARNPRVRILSSVLPALVSAFVSLAARAQDDAAQAEAPKTIVLSAQNQLAKVLNVLLPIVPSQPTRSPFSPTVKQALLVTPPAENGHLVSCTTSTIPSRSLGNTWVFKGCTIVESSIDAASDTPVLSLTGLFTQAATLGDVPDPGNIVGTVPFQPKLICGRAGCDW